MSTGHLTRVGKAQQLRNHICCLCFSRPRLMCSGEVSSSNIYCWWSLLEQREKSKTVDPLPVTDLPDKERLLMDVLHPVQPCFFANRLQWRKWAASWDGAGRGGWVGTARIPSHSARLVQNSQGLGSWRRDSETGTMIMLI